MKKWGSIIGLALVVSLVFLTSCASSSENYQVQKATYRSSYDTGSYPAPEITLEIPATSYSAALGLDAPAYSPASIADRLFGSSEQSYPVSVGGSSGDGKYSTTPVTATVAPTVVSGASQPMIVRTGSLNMVVKDIPTAIT